MAFLFVQRGAALCKGGCKCPFGANYASKNTSFGANNGLKKVPFGASYSIFKGLFGAVWGGGVPSFGAAVSPATWRAFIKCLRTGGQKV